MKRLCLVLLSVFFLVSFVSSNIYYEAEMNFNDGEISLVSLDGIYSRKELSNPYVEDNYYVVSLFDSDSNKIYSEEFSVVDFYIETYYDEERNEVVKMNDFNFFVYVPYYEDAKSLVIYDSSLNPVLEKEIIYGGLVQDNSFDEGNSVLIKKNNYLFYIILFVLILVLISVIFYIFAIRDVKKKKPLHKVN